MEIQALGGLWNISLQIFYENAFPIWDVLGCTFPTTYVTYFSRTLYIPTQGSVRTLSHHQYSPRDALKVLKFNPSSVNMRIIKKWKCQSLSDETKKFQRDRYRDFFSRPKFSRPRPRFFFETNTRLFFETKCFRD